MLEHYRIVPVPADSTEAWKKKCERRLRHFWTWCAKHSPPIETPAEATHTVVSEYLDEKLARSPDALGEAHKIKGLLIQWARHFNLLLVPKRIPLPRVPKGVDWHMRLSYEEDAAFLESVKGTRWEIAYYLARMAGLRISDVTRLRWCDVYLDSNPPEIIVRNSKSWDHRVIPLIPELIDQLRRWKVNPLAGKTLLMEREGGKPYKQSPGSYEAREKKAPRAKGWRSLRKTFASALTRGGVPLPIVSRVLGHRSVTTTMRYIIEPARVEDIEKCLLTRPSLMVQSQEERGAAPAPREDA